MKAVLRWTLQNSVFAALTYYGVVEHVEGAYNVALFIIWVMFIIAFAITMKMDDVVKSAKNYSTIPLWLDQLYDVCILAVWIWYGHEFFATLYLLHMFPLAYFKKQVQKKFKEQVE